MEGKENDDSEALHMSGLREDPDHLPAKSGVKSRASYW